MHFSIQLSAYYPDKSYGGDRAYRDMLEQARCADQAGYESVGITEHHLINILMMPAPLQFAVKIASQTQNIKIITAVSVLPLHDMRILAGELVCADIFTDQRLMVGVGRGAFGFEMERTDADLVTVYLPGAPDPWSGSVVFLNNDRVQPLGTEFGDTVDIFEKLGRDSAAILAGCINE